MLNANSSGDKIFQRGPNISEGFVPGGSKNFNKIEIKYPGVQIFRYIWIGETKNGVHFLCDRPSAALAKWPCEPSYVAISRTWGLYLCCKR